MTKRWCMTIPPVGAARMVATHALEALSCTIGQEKVKCFDTLTYRNGFNQLLKIPNQTTLVDLINHALIVSCLDFGASVLLVPALSPVSLFSLNLLRRYSVITVHWLYEDYNRATYWHDILSGYDHFCAIQKGPLPEECKRKGISFHFLPTATTIPSVPYNQYPRLYDIAFIGIPSPYRIEYLENLLNRGYKLAIAGSGWKEYDGPLRSSILSGNWTNEAQVASILTQAKIGIQLSVDKPTNRTDTHISPRVFDILAAGCILVAENVPLLHDSIPDCHFHTFDSINELQTHIDHILQNYENEKSTCAANQTSVYANHSFNTRINQLLNVVNYVEKL